MEMTLVSLVALVFFGERIVEIIKPWFEPLFFWLAGLLKSPEAHSYITMMFSVLVIGVLTYLSGANAMANIIPSPVAGRIITIIATGGGAGKLYDLFKPVQP